MLSSYLVHEIAALTLFEFFWITLKKFNFKVRKFNFSGKKFTKIELVSSVLHMNRPNSEKQVKAKSSDSSGMEDYEITDRNSRRGMPPNCIVASFCFIRQFTNFTPKITLFKHFSKASESVQDWLLNDWIKTKRSIALLEQLII